MPEYIWEIIGTAILFVKTDGYTLLKKSNIGSCSLYSGVISTVWELSLDVSLEFSFFNIAPYGVEA